MKNLPANPSSQELPVQLHLSHSWGGGVWRWVQDYCSHDKQCINLVLRSIGEIGLHGQQMELSIFIFGQLVSVRKWQLTDYIKSTALDHLEYKAVINEIIRDFNIKTILISSLIGHSLDVLNTGLPTVIVAHDYYPFCQAIHIYYNQICSSCTREKLSDCYKNNAENFLFNVSPEEWLVLREAYRKQILNENISVVYPTPSVKNYYEKLMPELTVLKNTVITHGAELELTGTSVELDFKARIDPDVLKIIILGRLTAPKGLNLLKKMLPRLNISYQLFLIGCGNEAEKIFQRDPHIFILKDYANNSLVSIMNAIQPDLALMLSIVPETFSYTLSELMMLGIPVLATHNGSFADRIEEGVNGFLCEPSEDKIAEKIKILNKNREPLQKVKQVLSHAKHKSVGEMIQEYENFVQQIFGVLPHDLLNQEKHQKQKISFVDVIGALLLSVSKNADINLKMVYQSTSWKVTYPLRKSKELWGKLKGKAAMRLKRYFYRSY